MTTSSLPYNFKDAFGETTIISMGEAGTIVATGDLAVSGKADVSGNMDVGGAGTIDGNTTLGGTLTLSGVMQAGPASQRGYPLLIQEVDVSGNNTKKSVTLPPGSDIFDIKLVCRSAFSASAASVVDVIVGTSADDAKLERFTNVSAAGVFRSMANSVDVSGMVAVSGANAVIVVGATAVSGAIASGGRGTLSIAYINKQ